MDNTIFSSFKIEERSYISIVKRDIHKIVEDAGFSTLKVGEIDIIIAELTSNLIKHTDRGGELIYRICCAESSDKYFEVYCIDGGPGTNDISRLAKDGNSSSNTLGHGLGAINRLSDYFQIYSMRGWGTVLYARKYITTPPLYKPKESILLNTIQESYPGEKVCGDGYYIKHLGDETQIFLGDGLGHGHHAHDAIMAAINAFKSCEESNPIQILRFIHDKVKKTRGLVGTVAILNSKLKTWRIAGIGNISTRMYSGLEYKNYMPHNGIIGLNIPTSLSVYEGEAERYQTIIMASDGIKTKWDIAKYTSILKYDPAILAAAIFKDHARKTDDMTVLVGKITI